MGGRADNKRRGDIPVSGLRCVAATSAAISRMRMRHPVSRGRPWRQYITWLPATTSISTPVAITLAGNLLDPGVMLRHYGAVYKRQSQLSAVCSEFCADRFAASWPLTCDILIWALVLKKLHVTRIVHLRVISCANDSMYMLDCNRLSRWSLVTPV